MSGPTLDYRHLADDLRRTNSQLQRGCEHYGVTAVAFRTAKFIFYIATLATTVWLIQHGDVQPTLAMGFAVLLISGPEALETFLIHQGKLDKNDGQ